jgi:RHS repeat-associated protein
MKKGVIFLIFLVVSMPIAYASVFEVPDVREGDVPAPLREDSNVKKFVYAGNNIIASIEDSDINYYHQGRMSNRVTTDSSGDLGKEFKSLPFGQKIENSGVDYPFTGKEEDESGLYYFGARYYDDNLGRFSSVDPVAGNHPYSYVSNNPMNLVDPDGMEELEILEDYGDFFVSAPAENTFVEGPDNSGTMTHFPSVSYLWSESQWFRSDEEAAAHFWMGLPHALLADFIYNLPGSNANRLDSPEIARSDAEFVEFTAGSMALIMGAARPPRAPGPAGTGRASEAIRSCFTGDTKIVMGDKTLKKIKDVNIGDIVLSYEFDNGVVEPSEVVNKFESVSEYGYYFVINNRIEVTPEHPFFVDNGWMEVEDIKIGQNLFNIEKGNISVISSRILLGNPIVYNIEVEGNHNYFVEGFLVHNKAMRIDPDGPIDYEQYLRGAGNKKALTKKLKKMNIEVRETNKGRYSTKLYDAEGNPIRSEDGRILSLPSSPHNWQETSRIIGQELNKVLGGG